MRSEADISISFILSTVDSNCGIAQWTFTAHICFKRGLSVKSLYCGERCIKFSEFEIAKGVWNVCPLESGHNHSTFTIFLYKIVFQSPLNTVLTSRPRLTDF